MQSTPGNGCVLVVEDHADTRHLLTRLLRMQGYVVYEAATCEDALAVLEREHCRVVVSDIGLPDGSGLQLLQSARARQLDVRALAISGHASAADADAARDAGFERHLPKPFKFDDLLDELRRLMN